MRWEAAHNGTQRARGHNMPLLSDDGFPQPERERRATIYEAIGRLTEQVEETWKQVEPELLEAVAKGDYDREYALRLRTRELVNNLRREIKELQALLSPRSP